MCSQGGEPLVQRQNFPFRAFYANERITRDEAKVLRSCMQCALEFCRESEPIGDNGLDR